MIDKKSSKIIKGTAIFFVLLCHVMGYFGDGIVIFTPLGGIGVSMFIFLSAYGINESWKSCGKTFWFRKRLISVILPYAVIQILLFWCRHKISLLSFFMDIFLIVPKHVYGWYLNYIFLWYLIFYVTMRLGFLAKHKKIVFIVSSIIMFFVCHEIRAEQSLSFFSGILCSENDKNKKENITMNWKTGIILVVIGVIFLLIKQLPSIRSAHVKVYDFIQLLIKLPIGLGVSIIVVNIIYKLKTTKRIISLLLQLFYVLGEFSYEIYLVHGYILYQVPKSVFGILLFLVILLAGVILLKMIVTPMQLVLKNKLCIKNS